uniref:Centromere-associated protein E n=1 Tax=Rhizophora mucronata TaxID=61149 RepID=A0A2P2ILL8_RHIMU
MEEILVTVRERPFSPEDRKYQLPADLGQLHLYLIFENPCKGSCEAALSGGREVQPREDLRQLLLYPIHSTKFEFGRVLGEESCGRDFPSLSVSLQWRESISGNSIFIPNRSTMFELIRLWGEEVYRIRTGIVAAALRG